MAGRIRRRALGLPNMPAAKRRRAPNVATKFDLDDWTTAAPEMTTGPQQHTWRCDPHVTNAFTYAFCLFYCFLHLGRKNKKIAPPPYTVDL
eukprot:SAG31_NODE_2692_length_5239_cov_52.795525_8_plen_91_part_00